jgi:predicted esterase
MQTEVFFYYMAKSHQDVLVSGKTSFKVEVPYTLIESGEKGGEKPLIIYLHGFGENIKSFKKSCSPLLEINAYHLFIQGPYPIYDRSRKKNVSDWGRAWYLYDGNRGQFIKSLELASEFIQEIIDKLLNHISVNRLCVMGYSMGGYLGGYFALTRWKHVNDLIVVGARIKTEVLHEEWKNVGHLNVLALHGKNDDSVRYEPQEKEINLMKEKGLNAELKLLPENHSFTDKFVKEINSWLNNIGY